MRLASYREAQRPVTGPGAPQCGPGGSGRPAPRPGAPAAPPRALLSSAVCAGSLTLALPSEGLVTRLPCAPGDLTKHRRSSGFFPFVNRKGDTSPTLCGGHGGKAPQGHRPKASLQLHSRTAASPKLHLRLLARASTWVTCHVAGRTRAAPVGQAPRSPCQRCRALPSSCTSRNTTPRSRGHPLTRGKLSRNCSVGGGPPQEGLHSIRGALHSHHHTHAHTWSSQPQNHSLPKPKLGF